MAAAGRAGEGRGGMGWDGLAMGWAGRGGEGMGRDRREGGRMGDEAGFEKGEGNPSSFLFLRSSRRQLKERSAGRQDRQQPWREQDAALRLLLSFFRAAEAPTTLA